MYPLFNIKDIGFSYFSKSITMFTSIFLIFHDLISFYENFMIFIYEENNLLSHKMNFLFILI